jgi:hypothetical protein
MSSTPLHKLLTSVVELANRRVCVDYQLYRVYHRIFQKDGEIVYSCLRS